MANTLIFPAASSFVDSFPKVKEQLVFIKGNVLNNHD